MKRRDSSCRRPPRSALATGRHSAPAIAQVAPRSRSAICIRWPSTARSGSAIRSGRWQKHGVELDLVKFTTGLELFQAMIGGSIDMLVTGAVISNFPARGQGKMFLINDVEFATAQLWVHEDKGIKTFADLKGKKISTTTGTTAHVFLDTALRANSVDPKEVEVVNQRMSEAVTSFISGAVPAVALWVPFNIPVREQGAGREDADRRVGLLSEGGDRRRLGGARRLLRQEP